MSDNDILELQADNLFFEWMQRRHTKQEWQQFQQDAYSQGYTDPEGIKNMWKEYRQSDLIDEQTDEKHLHDLKYDTEHALQQGYASTLLLTWMATDPKPVDAQAGDDKVKMYVLPLPDGNITTLNESQYKKLREVAKTKIEMELNAIQNQKDRYQFHKNDRNWAEKGLDVAAGAELEGKSWKAIDDSVQAGRDALSKGDLKTSLERIQDANKSGKVAHKEWDRYVHSQEVAGEVWIEGLETVKVGSEVVLAVGTAPLGGTGLVIVTGKGVTETVALAAVKKASGEHVDLGDVTFDVSAQVVTGLAMHGLGKLQQAKGPVMSLLNESFGGQLATDAVQSVLIDSANYAARRAYEDARGRGEKFTSQDFMNHFQKYLTDPGSLPLDVVKAQVMRHAGGPVAEIAEAHGISLERGPKKAAAPDQPVAPGPLPGEAAAGKGTPAEQPVSQGLTPGEGVPVKLERPSAGPGENPEAGRGSKEGGVGKPASAEREAAGKGSPGQAPEQSPSLNVEVSGLGPKGKPAPPRKNPGKKPPIPASNEAGGAKGQAAKESVPAGNVPEGAPAGGTAEAEVIDLPDSSVIHNLSPEGARIAYENSIKEDPHRETGIWEDAQTGERVVVQGNSLTVDTTTVLYSHPEFANRQWKMVEHYHPGEDALARIPSPQDFGVITHGQTEGAEPRGPVSSEIRYIDPVSKQPAVTRFGYEPNTERPYYIEYTATDGSQQRQTFVDPPENPNSDFKRFVDGFTGGPEDKVPPPAGGDEVEPVTQRKPPVESEAAEPPTLRRPTKEAGAEKGGAPEKPGKAGSPPPHPASPANPTGAAPAHQPPAPAGPPAASGTTQSASWEELTRSAERPAARQAQGGFRSSPPARQGNREVRIIEGTVGAQLPQSGSMAGYTPTLPTEHATHAVGMQLGENLPEGITSAAGRFNISEMKTVENAIRSTADAAAAQGTVVETRTILRIEYATQNGVEVPVLVGIQREASVAVPGSDKFIPFVDFRARLDQNTRQVVVEKNWIRRPGRR